jgi:hypothetical protein
MSQFNPGYDQWYVRIFQSIKEVPTDTIHGAPVHEGSRLAPSLSTHNVRRELII